MPERDVKNVRGCWAGSILFGLWVSGVGPVYLANRHNGESKVVSFVMAQLWPAMVPLVISDWIETHPRYEHTKSN